MARYCIVICFCILLLAGCKPEEDIPPQHNYALNLPSPFPAIYYPEDNAYTPARWRLGKKLFYDNILSIDSTLSCASCHKSELAFSDDVALSKGVKNRDGHRNAPTLANVAYHPYYTREGGIATLEQQVLVPLQEHNEFDFNILLAGQRLALDSSYSAMSLEAYGRSPDFYVITRALANFQRSIVSKSSPFDAYLYEKNENAITSTEKRGLELFYGDKAKCSSCHGGPDFTDYSFQNNGLYESYADNGRRRLTGDEVDEALFKVPSLRNIEVTAPYMHDGSIATLEEVVQHYNTGGRQHMNKGKTVGPLHLTQQEKSDLLAFLLTLTDDQFLTDKKYKK